MSYKINYSVYKIKNKITNQCYIGVDSYYPKGIKRINHPNYNKWLGGEKHPVSKLTFKQICEIRLKYLNREKQIKLAKDYNISKIMINAIITHRNWQDNNYIYLKKKDFNTDKYLIIKKYLNETLQTYT